MADEFFKMESMGGSCCGVTEWGSHGMVFTKYKSSYQFGHYSIGDTPQELFNSMMSSPYTKGFMNHIHFVNRVNSSGEYPKGWEWPEFRELIRGIPNVQHLGTFKNPNTGNMIDSYAWLDTQEPERNEYDEDEF